MKTLLQSSSFSKLISGDNRGGFLFAKDHVLGRPDICFFKCQKHVNGGGFVSPQQQKQQHKKKTMIICSVSSSSSLSSESQEELEAPETQTQEIDQSKTVHVKLQLQKECKFGEKFLIVGDDPMFGLWDASDAIPLDWSEEHLWTVELDIPIGKLIQFKFILKGNMGNILWQPGPDRILRTWETNNTITVLEDWENAEFQEIMEEGPIQTKNEVSFVTSDMLIDDEIFTKVNNDTTRAKNIAGNNGKASALSNPTNSQDEKILVNHEGGPVLVPGLAPLSALPTENNGKASALCNQANSQNEKILVDHEGSPVLVPGLAPLSALQTEEAPLYQEDKHITMESSIGPDEAKNWNASEFIEQQEPVPDLHREVVKLMVKGEELHSSELQQNPEATRVKEQLQSDMQWGREILQKLFINLGFS